MSFRLNRRQIVGGLAAFAGAGVLPSRTFAQDFLDLDWPDLVPATGGVDFAAMQAAGVVRRGEYDTYFVQETAVQVTRAFDGQRVRIPGFMTPLEFADLRRAEVMGTQGLAISEFLLVPYAGACIHVPPPPANQIVIVTCDPPAEDFGLYTPVWVTGIFQAIAIETQLAEVGYQMIADSVELYRE